MFKLSFNFQPIHKKLRTTPKPSGINTQRIILHTALSNNKVNSKIKNTIVSVTIQNMATTTSCDFSSLESIQQYLLELKHDIFQHSRVFPTMKYVIPTLSQHYSNPDLNSESVTDTNKCWHAKGNTIRWRMKFTLLRNRGVSDGDKRSKEEWCKGLAWNLRN